jgi:putative ABC transport system permease protein
MVGRLLLIARLVARDLRHRPSEAVLLLLAIAAAATTLTLGLVLHGVTAHSGPYPFSGTTLRVNGYTVPAMAEGRDQAPSAVDRPELTAGSWVRPGGGWLAW